MKDNNMLQNYVHLDIEGFDHDHSSLSLHLSLMKEISDTIIISLDGRFDGYSSVHFSIQMNKLLALNYTVLIFDCSDLTYITSEGIGSIIKIMKTLKTKNGEIIFMNLQSRVKDTFELLGFSKIFAIMNSIEEVAKYIEMNQKGEVSTNDQETNF